MTKRSGYQSLVSKFLQISTIEIAGELTRAQSGSVETLQRNAWIQQI